MKRVWIIVLLVLITLVGSGYYTIHRPQKQYNLILISIDALKPDRMGVYGYKNKTTPNIDVWAKQATVFSNVVSVAPFTITSFTALFTGKHITNLKGQKARLEFNTSNASLAEILKKQGYSTAGFVQNKLLFKDNSQLHLGFDQYTDYNEGKKIEAGLIDDVKKWIVGNSDKKMFLWVHIMPPHYPYVPYYPYICAQSEKECNEIRKIDLVKMEKEVKAVTGCNKNSLSPSGLNNLQNLLYDSEVNYSDYLFGQILAQIKKSGLDKNSIIVLYGDHGEGFDHNYYYAHAENVYQSTIRIPLIITHPQMTNRQEISRLIQNVDLSSLFQKIVNKKEDFNTEIDAIKRDMAYSISYGTGKFAAISSDGYKYIYSSDDTCLLNNQSEELYNLTLDPQEQNNIIESASVPAKQLKNLLGEYVQGLKQQMPRTKKDDLGNAIRDLKSQLSTVQEDQNKSTLEDLKSLGY